MLPEITTIVPPEKFDQMFSDEAIIADCTTPEEEDEYERLDSVLIQQIRNVVESHFGLKESDQPHLVEDWWPNHTRYIDADEAHFRMDFLSNLHKLLSKQFCDYRIQLCVYGDKFKGATYIGSIALYSDRLVVEENLHKVMTK